MIEWKRRVVWTMGALAGCAALSVLPGRTLAQISPDGGPVNASAIHDRDETDKQTGVETMYLDDQVEMLQTGRRLRCDHAKIIQAPFTDPVTGVTSKQTIQMEATGNVFYIMTNQNTPGEDQIVHGDYGIYTKSDDMLKITGNVIVKRGKSVATGNLFTDKVHDGYMTMVSDANSANHGRVRAIMYPNENKKPGTAPKAAPTQAPAPAPAHP